MEALGGWIPIKIGFVLALLLTFSRWDGLRLYGSKAGASVVQGWSLCKSALFTLLSAEKQAITENELARPPKALSAERGRFFLCDNALAGRSSSVRLSCRPLFRVLQLAI